MSAKTAAPQKIYYDNKAYEEYEARRAAIAERMRLLKRQSTTARVFLQQPEAQFRKELQELAPGAPIKPRFEEGEVRKLAIAKVRKMATEDRNVILHNLPERERSFLKNPMSGTISNQKNEHLAAASIGGIVVPNEAPGSKGTYIEWFRANYNTEVHLTDEGISLPKLKHQVVNEKRTDNGEMIFARARYLIEKDGKPALGDLDPRFHKSEGVARTFTRAEVRDAVRDIAKKTFAFQAAQQASTVQQRQRSLFAQAAANAGRAAQALPQLIQAPQRDRGGYAPVRGMIPA